MTEPHAAAADPASTVVAAIDASMEVVGRLRDGATVQRIVDAAAVLVATLQADGRILTCGNGGSMCDAMHLAEELSGRFRESRPGLGAMAISDPSHLSCTANDFGYDHVFSRFVEAFARPGDALVAISTSGSSENVRRAAEAARAKGVRVVSLTGRHGSAIGELADVDVCTPGHAYADRVQEAHGLVIHILIELIEQSLREVPAPR